MLAVQFGQDFIRPHRLRLKLAPLFIITGLFSTGFFFAGALLLNGFAGIPILRSQHTECDTRGFCQGA